MTTPHWAVQAFWLPILSRQVEARVLLAASEVGAALNIPEMEVLHNLAVEQAADKQVVEADKHILVLKVDKVVQHKPAPTDRAAIGRRFGVVGRNMIGLDIQEVGAAGVGMVVRADTAQDWLAGTRAPGASRCDHKNTTALFWPQ